MNKIKYIANNKEYVSKMMKMILSSFFVVIFFVLFFSGSSNPIPAFDSESESDDKIIWPNRPLYGISENNARINNARNLVNTYSEEEWLRLAPTQAPRSHQKCPNCAVNGNWIWIPKDPNKIMCNGCKVVFPDEYEAPLIQTVTVMTGKKIDVPYYRVKGSSSEISFIQARIDYEKVNFIQANISDLSAAYIRFPEDEDAEKYARYVALWLDKWADAAPDFFMTRMYNVNALVSLEQLSSIINPYVHRASYSNGFVNELKDAEINAFDRIYESKALSELSAQKGYDARKHILDNLLLNITLWCVRAPINAHAGTNLTDHIGRIIRVAGLAETMAEREEIMAFIDKYYETVLIRNIKRDGMFPESFDYHRQYVAYNYRNILRANEFFRLFPPTTPKMKAIAASTADRVEFCYRSTHVHEPLSFPNGDLAPFDDTHAGRATSRTTTKSALLPAYQHGMIGDGAGINQIQSNIGANDKANHVGNSQLSMTLFANGEEQLGDIRYSRGTGRSWTNSVQAHNTVAIDEVLDQYTSNHQGFGNSGHVFTNGYFSLFEPNLEGVSAMEVYSNTIRPNKVTRYQRLQILNAIEQERPYIIDVFVVQGGTQHDYLLQGSTQIDQTWSCSQQLEPLAAAQPLLPSGQSFNTTTAIGNYWGAFNTMSSGTFNAGSIWNVTFKEKSGNTGVKIWSVNNQTTRLYVGFSPYGYRRREESPWNKYARPALVERRTVTSGGKTVFVHVLETFATGNGTITSVERLPLSDSSDEFVALAIEFSDGRKDVIMVNMNDRLITGKMPTQMISTVDGIYKLTGKIGVFTKQKGQTTMKCHLISGSHLSYGTNTISIDHPIIEGTIESVTRKLDGASVDALITSTEVNLDTPRWIRLIYGPYSINNKPNSFPSETQTNMNELFEISGVSKEGGKTQLICKEDPYLIVSPNRTEEIQRPQRVFHGPTGFMITKSKTGAL